MMQVLIVLITVLVIIVFDYGVQFEYKIMNSTNSVKIGGRLV